MRAQAHTLEAFVAAMLLLASIVFALQVTAVTPLTASTSSQHIESQQGSMARGVLTSAAADGTLKPTVLFWNTSGGDDDCCFWNTSREEGYSVGGPPTPFGESLNETFVEQGIAVNVNIYHADGDDQRARQQLVHFGEPSAHATTATRTVTLYDDDRLYDHELNRTGETLKEGNVYATDAAPDSNVYNVVVVEVVAWRM